MAKLSIKDEEMSRVEKWLTRTRQLTHYVLDSATIEERPGVRSIELNVASKDT